jgi:nucleotide-binding universal stress UspA family protein
MLKSFLVAVDGSDYASGAVNYAAELAKTSGSRLTLLYVIDIVSLEGPFLADLSGSVGITPFLDFQDRVRTAMEEKATVVVKGYAASLKEEGLECATKIETGVVSRAICQEAAEHDAIVIGRRGEHASWRGFLLGSVVEEVVRGCTRPVVVTTREARPLRKVLVAYDGSRYANRALGVAASMAESRAIPVTVVCVSSDSQAGERHLDEAAAFLEPHGIEPERILESGPATEGILAAAERTQSDLIIMGAFGHSRVRELFLGSTTDGILRKAKIPVLLYR